MNRSAREGKSVKRFERSSGPDIALYKNYLLTTFYVRIVDHDYAHDYNDSLSSPRPTSIHLCL